MLNRKNKKNRISEKSKSWRDLLDATDANGIDLYFRDADPEKLAPLVLKKDGVLQKLTGFVGKIQ